MSEVVNERADKRWYFEYDRLEELKQEHINNLLTKYKFKSYYIELGADGWELVLCNPIVSRVCEGVKVLGKKRDMSTLDLNSARRVAGV